MTYLTPIPRLAKLGFSLCSVLLFFSAGRAAVAESVPGYSADEIVQRALRQAQQNGSRSPDYRYTRLTITEELDDHGKIKERKEKLYDASSGGDLPILKSIRINGQPVSAAKVQDEQARETRVRQQLSARKGPRRDMTEIVLTPELVAKYRFTLGPTEVVNSRQAYVLRFEPRSETLPVTELADRLLNHLSGKLWIDQEDFEIAKAEMELQTEVRLWGGLLATLRKVSLHLTRTRVEPGVWFNNSATGQFEGRKLLAATRVRTASETTNFRRVEAKTRG